MVEVRGSLTLTTLSKGWELILHFAVDVKELFTLGKRYSWPRPERCPACCGNRLWGHGYVIRYFEGFWDALWVKRFRCPDCFTVHTCRPCGFLKGIRFSVEVVSDCLRSWIEEGRWLSSVVRQNQQYWHRCLRRWSSRLTNVINPLLSHLQAFLSDRIFLIEHCEPVPL